MTRYKINYKPIEDGWWLATVEGLEGCLTQGCTITQARERIREALGLWVDDVDAAELIDNIQLPAKIRKAATALSENRRELAEKTEENRQVMFRLVTQLSKTLKLSTRDIAYILKISHQRVQQILHKQKLSKTRPS